MKDFIQNMFAESSSVSLTRVVTFMTITVALGIAIYGAYKNQQVTELVSLLLGIAMTGKVAQKFIETK